MNRKTLVVCGDSFNYGIGCVDLKSSPYGVLTAEYFDWNLVRLARGAASNYTTFLQGMYAADMQEKPHLVILGETSYDRAEWISEKIDNPPVHHTALDINYHGYPPHNDNSNTPFHFTDDPLYNPIILSEQIGGIHHALSERHAYPRLNNESTQTLEMIRDYYVDIWNQTKPNYDVGMILQAYTYIKRKNIKCIIITHSATAHSTYSRFVDNADIMVQDWFSLSKKFPDKIGSMHTSEEGHADTATRLINKIKDSGYDK